MLWSRPGRNETQPQGVSEARQNSQGRHGGGTQQEVKRPLKVRVGGLEKGTEFLTVHTALMGYVVRPASTKRPTDGVWVMFANEERCLHPEVVVIVHREPVH